MEGFLDLNIPIWMRVTFTRLVAIGPGLVVAILTQDNQNLSDKCVVVCWAIDCVLSASSHGGLRVPPLCIHT